MQLSMENNALKQFLGLLITNFLYPTNLFFWIVVSLSNLETYLENIFQNWKKQYPLSLLDFGSMN